MKYLLINAHPQDKSYNQALTQFLSEWLIKEWHSVKHINTADISLPYYDSSIKRTQNSEFQDLIDWCDHLVFIFPIWNMDCPASMKNFFDSQFCKWFSYKNSKWKQIWLLWWKISSIIATCGWPRYVWLLIQILGYFIRGKWRIEFAWMEYHWYKILSDTVTIWNKKRQSFMKDCLERLCN